MSPASAAAGAPAEEEELLQWVQARAVSREKGTDDHRQFRRMRRR
jgi:hypothetical protein